jgi:hypothetical protein
MRLPSSRGISIFCLLSCFITALPRASAQGTQQAILNDAAEAFINQVLTDWNSPGGVAVAVVRRDGQGNWNVETKGYGVATANGSKVTENTLFALASNSKVKLHFMFQAPLTACFRRVSCAAFYGLRHGASDRQQDPLASDIMEVKISLYCAYMGFRGPNCDCTSNHH